MKEITNIYFRNKPLSTLKDLLTYLSMPHTFQQDEDIQKIHKKEVMLFQQQKTLPNGSENMHDFLDIPSRSYSLKEMINAQNQLELLVLLETLRYRNNIVNARSAQRKYLHDKFNLEFFIKNLSGIKTISNLALTEQIALGNQSVKFNSYDKNHSDPKSIREYFNDYLHKRYEFSKVETYPYKIIRSSQRSDSINAGREFQPNFYLSFNDIPEFLLLFAFNDGREFILGKETTRLPKISPTKMRSEISYKKILYDIQQFYPHSSNETTDIICHRHRLNQMFLFSKLNSILHYYNLYTSVFFLDQILQIHTLTYNDILNLKQHVVSNIFEDEDFIGRLLLNPCLDGFLLFDILFQANSLFHVPGMPPKTLETFLNNINSSKEKTINIIEKPFWHNYDLTKFLFISDNSLDIVKSEKNIINDLLQNRFFQKYYVEENQFLTTYLQSPTKLILPFDKLKAILPE